jgi:hypothetical protein
MVDDKQLALVKKMQTCNYIGMLYSLLFDHEMN